MSDCVGYVTPFFNGDGHKKAKSSPCRVAISLPNDEWLQLTAIQGEKSIRLSIPMTEFEKLILQADEILQAKGSAKHIKQ